MGSNPILRTIYLYTLQEYIIRVRKFLTNLINLFELIFIYYEDKVLKRRVLMARDNVGNVIRFRQRIKIALVAAFNNKCQICGLEEKSYIYDFHHIDASQKSFGIAASGETRSKEKIADEAQKCAMLCANCHRKIEHGDEDFVLISNFNREIFFSKIDTLCGRDKTNEIKIKEKDSLSSSKIEIKKNSLSREELKTKIRNTSFLEIGREFGVSDNAVRKWCVKHHLPRTKKEINGYSEEEWLII